MRFLAERLPLPTLLRLKREGEGVKGGAAGVGIGGKGKLGGKSGLGQKGGDYGEDGGDVKIVDEEAWTAYSICDGEIISLIGD